MKFKEILTRRSSYDQHLDSSTVGDNEFEILSERTTSDVSEVGRAKLSSGCEVGRSKRSSGRELGRSMRSSGRSFTESPISVLDFIAAGGNTKILPFYDIRVKSLTYKVVAKSKEKGTTEKVLLNGVNAEAYHGQILAIVGPSGSGKTTFLDALAGRVASRSLEGEVSVNGELIDPSFMRISGYVMQDDALFPMLTVRETLLYSARLRLQNSMTVTEKKNRVDNMIKALGLVQCADTRIGSVTVRGLSGGEKRRVSIGTDLIHDPAVLFLDEPTSGLDSTSALNVMQNLQHMAQSGRRTVLLSIHQPSYRLLNTIDRVLVLGKGNVIYHGPPGGIKHHFDPLGRSMPEFVNVIEYALDTIEEYEISPDWLAPLISLQASNENAMDLETGALGLNQEENLLNKAAANLSPEYATCFLSECFVLSHRNFNNTLRTPELFLSRLGLMVIMAIIVGTLFFRVKVNQNGVLQRSSYIAFVGAFLIFTSIEAIGSLLGERLIFIRETSRGAYRAGSYVVAGAVVALPLSLILGFVFSATGYFLVGFVSNNEAFFFFTLVVWLTLCMANSYVSFVSSIVPNFTIGNSVASGTVALFLLFSGFFIPRGQIPKYWIWLNYLSLFKYPYESLLKNEFGNKRFNNVTWGSFGSSEDVLIYFSSGAVHQWLNISVMIIFFVGYRVLFWLVLKYFTKSIRK